MEGPVERRECDDDDVDPDERRPKKKRCVCSLFSLDSIYAHDVIAALSQKSISSLRVVTAIRAEGEHCHLLH